MTRVGAEMVNPVSGERFVWRQTDNSTDGEFAEFDLYLTRGAAAAAHTFIPTNGQGRMFSGTGSTDRTRLHKSQ
jgi:hypothetical protein